MRIAEYTDELHEYQIKTRNLVGKYKELADHENRRRIRNKIFKDMDKQYHEGMYPICPHCNKVIDPILITSYMNKDFIDAKS